MRRTWVVFCKEVVDSLRDRRSLISALFYPLLGPAILVGIFLAVGQSVADKKDQPLDLPVIGSEHAPNLIQFLQQSNVHIQADPADSGIHSVEEAENKVSEGEIDVVLVIPASYGQSFLNGEPAPVQLILDDSRQSASTSVDRLRDLLQAYNNQMGRMRLVARGLSPSVIDVVAVETIDLSTPQSQIANLLNLVPYFIIFSLFMGGMAIAIDTTAGEKERGSLEPLLTTPAKHHELVFGKMGAALLMTLVAVFETLLGFAIGTRFLPLEEMIGVRINLSPLLLLSIFALTLPIMLLAAGVQMLIAALSKGPKEAQTYVSFLPLIPALPGMFLAFFPVKPAFWNMAIPTFGQQLLINRLMRGEAIDPIHVLLTTLTTFVLAALLIWAAIHFYGRERLVLTR